MVAFWCDDYIPVADEQRGVSDMTRREATIVSAYTGYFIGELNDLYNYLSEITGGPVYTHEIPAVLDEYHNKIRQDFVMLEVE